MLRSESMNEARRVMEICNACRYCEGFCAVFPAMTTRREFGEGDLNYLANLCHNCKGCYYACQFAPPHEFSINVPKVLAEVRAGSYERYARPQGIAGLLRRNGLVVSLTLVFVLLIAGVLSVLLQDPEALFSEQRGPGAFYRIIPYGWMVGGASLVFGAGLLALGAGFAAFWRESGRVPGKPVGARTLLRAAHEALTLRFLANGGDGCNSRDGHFSQATRHAHLLTMWGFMLCFAATAVATIYDHLLGLQAPYAMTSLPVLLGTAGGIGLVLGPIGQLWLKLGIDPEPVSRRLWGMDVAFIVLLLLTGASGLLLLALRESVAMGVLLTLHLAIVLTLFVTLPFSKMVHAVYRFAALLRYGVERR